MKDENEHWIKDKGSKEFFSLIYLFTIKITLFFPLKWIVSFIRSNPKFFWIIM